MLIVIQAKEKNKMNQNIQELEKYAVNLNERARASKLDPVIGRDDEIRRVIRSRKNMLLLLIMMSLQDCHHDLIS